jgi:Fur family peroxide stress response transcriptional regulator
MDRVIEYLKEKHIRVTPQRVGVYKIVSRENKHLTVEEIYGRIKKKSPAISLATVYAILELYVRKGLVGEVRIAAGKACFEARTDSHHHFYCKQCERIFDVNLHPCPALRQSMVEGHIIEKLHGYFYGTCSACKKTWPLPGE